VGRRGRWIGCADSVDVGIEEAALAKVVVDVVLKPEILDPQGQAIAGAIRRLGIPGVSSVRQGKHFELDVDDSVDSDTLARLADVLLSNPVIEDYAVRRQ
jgi:phosphoribosylformylglycinamidine synthase subunit PurS